jgi:hypothetical protein
MNRTSLAVPARTPLNQRLNPDREQRYTKLPPGSASGSDALSRRNYLQAKRAAKGVRKRIAIENKLAKLAKDGRIAQPSFRRDQ